MMWDVDCGIKAIIKRAVPAFWLARIRGFFTDEISLRRRKADS